LRVVVSDTSALIDLERGDLLEVAFRLPLQFCVPDLLYERELADNIGPSLCGFGLRIETLSATATARAQTLWHQRRALSLPDCFAFTLAEEQGWTLLTGDRALRAAAEAEKIQCHGFFWLFDQLVAGSVMPHESLVGSLDKLSSHPRCRLPAKETTTRLKLLREKTTK